MRKALIATVLIGTLGGGVFFSGCGSNPMSSAVSSVTESADSKSASLAPYIKAVSWFNNWSFTFNYATAPDLADMRAGKHPSNLNLPSYDRLQEELKEATGRGSSSFDSVDSSTKEVLDILEKLVPLSEKMQAYYSSAQYKVDGYAEWDKYVQEYLPLYDKFDAAYGKLDQATSQASYQISEEKIQAAKAAGHENEATFREMYLVASEIVETFDRGDNATVQSNLQKLQTLNNNFNPKTDNDNSGDVKSFKESMNSFIGNVRTYLSGDRKDSEDIIRTYNRMIDEMNDVNPNTLD